MTTVDESILPYPFNTAENLDLDPRYAIARDAATLPRVQLPFGEQAWLATRYEDVRTVLGDKRFSRAAAGDHDEPRVRAGQQNTGILSMDPPDHTRLRVLVSKAFTMRRVEALRPVVATLADELAATMLDEGQPADLVDLFALPLPVQVICELLGVPAEDRPRFRVWSDGVLSTTSLSAEQFDANREELRDYMRGLIAIKRDRPADDLMSALIGARDVDDKLSELELVDLCVGILVAGHETTATQIPNFVLYLLSNDGAWDRLRTDPSSIPGAVEELLRLVPLGLGGGQPRFALEDIMIGDTLVAAGDAVVVSIGAANRDPNRFDAPDLFDPERQESGHMGFGHGAHHCLGAALARMELQEALRALTEHIPGLRIRDLEWKTEMVVRGPRKLEIEW
ncbi:MAG: cytochrome P450 [Rhodococcus sp. (in: high G+C Gram-positive bacteria)]